MRSSIQLNNIINTYTAKRIRKRFIATSTTTFYEYIIRSYFDCIVSNIHTDISAILFCLFRHNKQHRAQSSMNTKRNKNRRDNQRHKKIKLQEDEVDHFNTILNDDCILEIFSYLRNQDLGEASETCMRFKRLANIQFRIKYPDCSSTNVNISVNDAGKIVVDTNCPFSDYRKYFIGCSQIVHIDRIDRKHSGKVIAFLRKNWHGNLKKLSFSYGNYIDAFGQNIETVLVDLNVLEFDYVSERNETVNEILKCCPQLKILRIDKHFISATGEYTQCPALEMIQCQVDSTHYAEKLTAFLQRNPSVTKLFCSFENEPIGESMSKLGNVVQLITATESISEFYLKIADVQNGPNTIDWNMVYQELKKLDGKDGFKRLELSINTHPFQMGALESLSGLQLFYNTTEILHRNPLINNQFSQLKTLCLHLEPENTTLCTTLSQNLPNLEEVWLVVQKVYDEHFEFVSFSAKLNKFVLIAAFRLLLGYNPLYEKVLSRMDSLNESRRKLTNASKMIVYLCQAFSHYDRKELFEKRYGTEDYLVSLRTANILNEFPNAVNPLMPTITL